MTLDPTQIALTAEEFRVNLVRAELTEDEAALDLGWTLERLSNTLSLTNRANPVDAWELRDYLYHAVKVVGRRPDFTVMTSASRLSARLWFPLRRAPRRSDQR